MQGQHAGQTHYTIQPHRTQSQLPFFLFFSVAVEHGKKERVDKGEGKNEEEGKGIQHGNGDIGKYGEVKEI